MSTMNIPGFTAEASLYETRGHYQTLHAARGRTTASLSDAVIPAAPHCSNCPDILQRCLENGGHPRGLCNLCASGHCYEEPAPGPVPHDPFPWPFDLFP